jgi:hypothetical protein
MPNISTYLRNSKGEAFGLIKAFPKEVNGTKLVFISISICNTSGDEFDKATALDITYQRAFFNLKYKISNVPYAVRESNEARSFIERYNAYNMLEFVQHFVYRCQQYYKDAIVVAPNVEYV